MNVVIEKQIASITKWINNVYNNRKSYIPNFFYLWVLFTKNKKKHTLLTATEKEVYIVEKIFYAIEKINNKKQKIY